MNLLVRLRQEDKTLKRKDLPPKLLDVVDYLLKTTPAYKKIMKEERVHEIKEALFNSTYQFSPMFRSWIPKPNKPGKMRPITQPFKEDLIVMEAIAHLLNIVFEDLFLPMVSEREGGLSPSSLMWKVGAQWIE